AASGVRDDAAGDIRVRDVVDQGPLHAGVGVDAVGERRVVLRLEQAGDDDAALVLRDRLLLVLLLRGDELLVHAAGGVDLLVPLHRLHPRLGGAGGDDLPGGLVPLEGLAGAEVAGQRAEADLEALLAVDEAGDGLAGAG